MSSSEGRSTAGREPWFLPAYLLVAAMMVVYLVLGLRPGGTLALFLWRVGRDLLFFAALGLLLFAAWTAWRRPPFVQGRRLRPLVALALVLFVAPFEFPYPSSHEEAPSAVDFRLPVDGEWRVFWGGESALTNRPALLYAEQRWALSLVRPAGQDAAGAAVLAPADGRVVRVREDQPDGALFPPPAGVPRLGNLIVLEVAQGEYCFLAHLQRDSVSVEVGDSVRSGQVLAHVGSSGASTLPSRAHLLTFLQDSPEEGRGEPIPWRFGAYLADGRPVEGELPRGGFDSRGQPMGQRVEHQPRTNVPPPGRASDG